MRFDEAAITCGVHGIERVMQRIGILEEAPERVGEIFVARRSSWVRAPRSGLFQAHRTMGDKCKPGDEIGIVTTPYGGESARVRACTKGVVIGLATNPLVFQGDALLHIATE